LILAFLFACFVFRYREAFAQSARIEKPLVIVSNPPPVQVLVPGFTVRELPLEVKNINNLVFATDGRLFALCYDGNVLQLKDTNGDGLEYRHAFLQERQERNSLASACVGGRRAYRSQGA
jgi:hypothetical protein